ncbi:hypothetical protein Tco_1307334 [Tanacetum coccineum]
MIGEGGGGGGENVLEGAFGGDGKEEIRIGDGVLLCSSKDNFEQQGFFGGLMVILGLLEALVFLEEDDDLVDTIVEEIRRCRR